MSWFRPRDLLDRFFVTVILIKGLDGLLDLAGGVLLLLVTPAAVNRFVSGVVERELSGDPNDLIATQLRHWAHGITGDTVHFVAAYLLVHAVVKIGLAVAVLRDELWAYPWLIGVQALFIGYQLYRVAVGDSPWILALAAFDAVVAVLTWREYQRHRPRKPARPDATSLS